MTHGATTRSALQALNEILSNHQPWTGTVQLVSIFPAADKNGR